MLKHVVVIFTLMYAFPLLACWNLQGSYAVDGETYKFSNKVEHNKDYLFTAGAYHIKLRFIPLEKKETLSLSYEIQERKMSGLVLVTKGQEEDVLISKQTDVFAKGEPGQPNTILSFKLTQI
jgi:hypothetical protein